MVLGGTVKLFAPMCPDCVACKMGSEKMGSKKGKR